MKKVYDMSRLEWTLSGYTPYLWKFEKSNKMGPVESIDVRPVRARVPGSVQQSLKDAGVIEDWNVGQNSRNCEWVENRHWIYQTRFPDDWLNEKLNYRVECLGLDYSGWIYVNDQEVCTFKGTHTPHVFDITPYLKESGNVLEIIFDLPPRWLGQFGYTSKMTEWKTRFNYTWDWIPRMVQIGIWDSIALIASDGNEFKEFRCATDADISNQSGEIRIKGLIQGNKAYKIRISLEEDDRVILSEEFTVSRFQNGIILKNLPVKLWWPNLEGEQPLYTVTCRLLDSSGNVLDSVTRRVGFKHVDWVQCEGAPAGADPWVCVVNGRPVFLQGVNFAPIRPNFADLTREDYAKRLKLYRELGCNMLRINACGFLEFECFYELCDELGLMVWQEFPLTSSGIDNWPPEDETSISELEEIAKSFIKRRQHHVSLTMWSGGNELMGDLEGRKTGIGKPCDLSHPMLKRLKETVEEYDPTRRFVPTSPSGPRAGASESDFGKGLHWDVHGPYTSLGDIEKAMNYWKNDDALFRSELCCPGANPVEITRQYKGEFQEFPANADNPYWTRPTPWWIDWDMLVTIHGHEPKDLEEYVQWSQEHQAEALSLGMRMCKERFPRCGGVLLWGSHDTFPIPANATIIDFHGNPKPAALALAKVWRNM